MRGRPACVVPARSVAALELRSSEGGASVSARVRPVSDAAGLGQMGVKIREIEPGHSGTHLHYHEVEEEWAFVLSGRGRLRLGPHEIAVRAGHFAGFAPAPAPHHFVAEGDEPLVILEGGERRPEEDACTYPALGLRVRRGVDEPIDVETLPRPVGDPAHVVHFAELPERAKPHPLNPSAIRHQRSLDEAAGLERQACCWVRIEPGIESTTFHTHDRTDEWVYLLSGEVDVRIGDEWHVAGEGDFIAHPAGGPAHVMRARSEATYLMGGQSLPGDVVTYPERGMILGPDGFESVDR